MAFVTCNKFKQSQDAQDAEIEKLKAGALSVGDVVAPSQIGKGIVWDNQTNSYQVNLGDGLIIGDDGKIKLKANEPVVNTVDNGTGVIIHKQAVIDFGGLIEVSGTMVLPLPEDPAAFVDLAYDHPSILAYAQRKKQVFGENLLIVGTTRLANSEALGMHLNEPCYYHEVGFTLDLAPFGISQVISASATAGDLPGWRKETAWVVNNIQTNTTQIPIGVHVYFTAGQTEISVSYTVKGLKG